MVSKSLTRSVKRPAIAKLLGSRPSRSFRDGFGHQVEQYGEMEVRLTGEGIVFLVRGDRLEQANVVLIRKSDPKEKVLRVLGPKAFSLVGESTVFFNQDQLRVKLRDNLVVSFSLGEDDHG